VRVARVEGARVSLLWVLDGAKESELKFGVNGGVEICGGVEVRFAGLDLKMG
jgi:hypothetical protein